MGIKVLLIDDSGLMRKMVSRALRQSGVNISETVEASNGQEGLEALSSHSPDLVLCDWNMPVMDGISFVKEALSVAASTPVIMLTTEGTADRVTEAKQAGAKGYVTKPFTPEKLGAAINDVLDAA